VLAISLHLSSSISSYFSFKYLIISHIEGTFTAALEIPEINNPSKTVYGDLII